MEGFNTGDGYMGLETVRKMSVTLFLCEPYKNIRRITYAKLPVCQLAL